MMLNARILSWLLAAACLLPALRAEENNIWPFYVGQNDASGQLESWQGAGPVFFSNKPVEKSTWFGVRPLYVAKRDDAGQITEWHVLYPVFSFHRYGDTGYRWNLVSLFKHDSLLGGNPKGVRRTEIWPFYFARETGDPATTYHGLFPLGGSIQDRFGNDRITWVLFPLYIRTEKNGGITTGSPWPFIKNIRGNGQRGFYLWPLFGWRKKEGIYDNRFWLWPFIYKNESFDPEAPGEKLGVLPFYARETGPGLKSETYLWPFFGYTDATQPKRYHETRYFWPFLLQGRGEEVYRNRWAPFYTHSIVKGYDKTWVAWPVFRQTKWEEGGLAQTKSQFLMFVYWSLVQRSVANPALAVARKTHLWPLVSAWDNGAGRRQVQIFSPLEGVLQYSEPTRMTWSPFFALYRYDQRTPSDIRYSFLFDLITWHTQPAATEFHIGPLFSIESKPATQRIALGNGLFAMERTTGADRWQLLWLDFHRKTAQKEAAATQP